MSKLIDGVKKAGGVVGTLSTAYGLAVGVEGRPVREPTAPAVVRVFGIPVFRRDESLDRVWFGFIKRGKSKVAKRYIAAGRPADELDVQMTDESDS